MTPTTGYQDKPMIIPCRKCPACLDTEKRQLAARVYCESFAHKHNWFLTPTYDEEHHPADGSLDPKHTQDFLKRLRYYGLLQKFLLCGEYGDSTGRPHYHLLAMGMPLDDLVFHKMSNGNRLYTSESIDKIWGKGHCLIGPMTEGSLFYTTGYVTKKLATEEQLQGRHPVFRSMSQGLGRSFVEKYWGQLLTANGIIIPKVAKTQKRHSLLRNRLDGTYTKVPLPLYFTNVIKEIAEKGDQPGSASIPRRMRVNQLAGLKHAKEAHADNSTERLRVKRELHHRKKEFHKRPGL